VPVSQFRREANCPQKMGKAMSEQREVAQRWSLKRRVAQVCMTVTALTVVGGAASTLFAKDACVYTKAIWDVDHTVCTDDAGSNCVTCAT
jgi:hypothetical protein